MKKGVFYILICLINIPAAMLVGISFLSGPSFYSSSLKIFFDRILFAIIVSLVFALLSFLLGFFFRRALEFTNLSLKKIFIYQFAAVLLAFITVTLIVTINS